MVGGLSGGLKKWEVKYYPIYPSYIFRDYFDKPWHDKDPIFSKNQDDSMES